MGQSNNEQHDHDERVAELRACLDAYLRTPTFEVRAQLACEEIQRGGLTDAKDLAHALGLPVEFLEIAFAKYAASYVADHGGIN